MAFQLWGYEVLIFRSTLEVKLDNVVQMVATLLYQAINSG